MKRVRLGMVTALAGYLAYSLVVVSFLLWWLFPDDVFKQWIQNRASRHLHGYGLEIKELALVFPETIRLEQVRLYAPEGKLIQQVDSVSIQPDWRAMLHGRKNFLWQAFMAGGSITGHFELAENLPRLFQGKFSEIKMDDLTFPGAELHRDIKGVLSGRFRCLRQAVETTYTCTGNLMASDGTIKLREPVFSLTTFDYSIISANMHLRDATLSVEKGRFDGAAMSGTFSGTVKLRIPLASSILRLKAQAKMRSELFAALRGTAMESLIKRLSQKGSLPLVLHGTLGMPSMRIAGTDVSPGLLKEPDAR